MTQLLPTEDSEQAAVCQWLDLRRVWYFAVPNGGVRAWKTARLMKKTGTKRGVPDLWIVSPPPRHPGLVGTVVEMKRVKGGKLSDAQITWLDELARLSWRTIVARGAGEAIAELTKAGY